ncbi:MAG TPA: DUF2127 domain-containing protein [Candidatus Angelobacter sp.]|nr:DUF2127 domain-containing protein [Candidatus Angelobacter sp.]
MQKHPQGFFVRHFGLRGVALFEAAKGAGAVLAAAWIMSLRHKDMKDVADNILAMLHRLLHINPDRHFFRLLQHSIEGLTHRGLLAIAGLIVIYAAIRFVEATGLWLEKEWAEWFALLTGGLYIPFEVYELFHHPTGVKWMILGINVVIVLYLAWLLQDSYQRRRAARETPAPRLVGS